MRSKEADPSRVGSHLEALGMLNLNLPKHYENLKKNHVQKMSYPKVKLDAVVDRLFQISADSRSTEKETKRKTGHLQGSLQ
ncbi:hypothetical protein B9Z55_015715 [Caenorhabditis nigoni]|uniref:Uncharacterized protein n=1 Tax=Caenorhabditis nigoni TaxID=1611254 RepID=A0A2G5UC16_9PELO|nr:hypothetical protein B9Z55_015715 [Caenorhabditis nigoni]